MDNSVDNLYFFLDQYELQRNWMFVNVIVGPRHNIF